MKIDIKKISIPQIATWASGQVITEEKFSQTFTLIGEVINNHYYALKEIDTFWSGKPYPIRWLGSVGAFKGPFGIENLIIELNKKQNFTGTQAAPQNGDTILVENNEDDPNLADFAYLPTGSYIYVYVNSSNEREAFWYLYMKVFDPKKDVVETSVNSETTRRILDYKLYKENPNASYDELWKHIDEYPVEYFGGLSASTIREEARQRNKNWSPTITYSREEYTQFHDATWIYTAMSLIDNNIGNNPETSPYWKIFNAMPVDTSEVVRQLKPYISNNVDIEVSEQLEKLPTIQNIAALSGELVEFSSESERDEYIARAKILDPTLTDDDFEMIPRDSYANYKTTTYLPSTVEVDTNLVDSKGLSLIKQISPEPFEGVEDPLGSWPKNITTFLTDINSSDINISRTDIDRKEGDIANTVMRQETVYKNIQDENTIILSKRLSDWIPNTDAVNSKNSSYNEINITTSDIVFRNLIRTSSGVSTGDKYEEISIVESLSRLKPLWVSTYNRPNPLNRFERLIIRDIYNFQKDYLYELRVGLGAGIYQAWFSIMDFDPFKSIDIGSQNSWNLTLFQPGSGPSEDTIIPNLLVFLHYDLSDGFILSYSLPPIGSTPIMPSNLSIRINIIQKGIPPIKQKKLLQIEVQPTLTEEDYKSFYSTYSQDGLITEEKVYLLNKYLVSGVTISNFEYFTVDLLNVREKIILKANEEYLFLNDQKIIVINKPPKPISIREGVTYE